MNKNFRRHCLMGCVAFVLLSVPAGPGAVKRADAATPNVPVLLGSFQDWDAYRVAEGSSQTCFALSSPKILDRQTGTARNPAYFMVTYSRLPARRAEPSLIAGYNLAPAKPVKIIIGEQRFNMFSQGDGGWVRDAADERRLVDALRGGATLVVQGTTAAGATPIDQYSLRGFNAALTAAEQACK